MAIAFDFEQIFAELKRISRELEHFPAAEEVAIVEGGVSPATGAFRNQLTLAANAMANSTDATITALNKAHDSIRAAVMQMAEQDAALADESKMILQLLDSAVAQAGTAPTSGRAPRAGESGAPGVEASADSDTTVEADY